MDKVSFYKSVDINFFQNLLLKRCRDKIQTIKNQRYAVIHSQTTKNNAKLNEFTQNNINFDQNNCNNSNSTCPFNIVK